MPNYQALLISVPARRFPGGASIVGLVLALAAGLTAEARTWTNDQGTTLEADFVRLRGATVFLRGEDKKLVRAPVERLSEEDQAWVDRYKELADPRDWGPSESPVRGRFELLRDEGVAVEQTGDSAVVTFDKLTPADWEHVEAYHLHLDRELPADFAAKRRAARASEPPADAPERDWVDARGRKIVGKYGGTSDAKAILWVKGKRFEVPLDKLSAADQKWVGQQSLMRLMADFQGGVTAAQSIASTIAAKKAAELAAPAEGMAPPPEPYGMTPEGDNPSERRMRGGPPQEGRPPGR